VLGFILAFAPRSGPGGSYYGYSTNRRRKLRFLPGQRHHDTLDLPPITGTISAVPGAGSGAGKAPSGIPGPGIAPVLGKAPGPTSVPRGVVPGPEGIPGPDTIHGPGGIPGPGARLTPGPSPRPIPPVVADLGTADERAG
jgi:succinoglycan biosynthesis transport protein ExoP